MVYPDRTVTVYGDQSAGQYDGADDTLVGVWDQSGSPVDAITVAGPGSDLSGLDGDGLCTYGVAGCPFGPTGYEGPKTSLVTDPALPDAAEVDFTGGLAPNATAYFSLEGALTSASLKARQGHLTGLAVTLSTRTYALGTDPANQAFEWLDISVTKADGSPAPNATLAVTRNGKTGHFTANASGQLHLLQPVRVDVSPRVDVTAQLGQDTGSASLNLYNVDDGTVCHVDGKPEKLNSLRHLLDLVGVPSIDPVFDGWIQGAGLLTQFIPARYATTLSGETFTGSGVSPLYELRIAVTDLKTNTTASFSDLFSRKKSLLDPLTGQGLPPLQQFARRMNCGSLA
ncbi:hypothetical protein FSW04_13860 [Baekduia soli]|uniref:Uncharacterized protein n=1 Tax=Baekduia soli TaxID=496014 RepID=A0A5B8U625_9ACTN|nr:hypothetical protein [Baekduia soli]QEC48544.1 hypothetical protein FSW04_13860 [Baekduia soli]